MERVAGIEPARPAWKAGVLPLNYTRLGNFSDYNKNGGGGRIRTFEVDDGRFTVCSLWPLGNPTTG